MHRFLREIAAAHDLTVVASGKGALSDLFPVDVARSVYRTPQRHLAMVNVTGLNDSRDVRHAPARYYELPTAGETVWTPYYHMTLGPSWNLFSEARAGSPVRLTTTNATATLAGLTRLLEEVRAEVVELQVRKASLDDVFLELTRADKAAGNVGTEFVGSAGRRPTEGSGES